MLFFGNMYILQARQHIQTSLDPTLIQFRRIAYFSSLHGGVLHVLAHLVNGCVRVEKKTT